MHDAHAWIASGQHFTTADGHRIFHRRQGRGPTVLLLHGFPTWSHDWAPIVPRLVDDFDVIALDFLGYGASDKPRDGGFTVEASASLVTELCAHLGVSSLHLVAHDVGALVAQALLDRPERGFAIESLHLLNASVFAAAYRPTRLQRLLLRPWVGPCLARLIGPSQVRRGLDRVRGPDHALGDAEFDALWHGIALQDGHRLAHRHVQYIDERTANAQRWERALCEFKGPIQLLWGLADPVSGAAALALAREHLPHAQVTAFEDVGHFPASEAPTRVAEALHAALSDVAVSA